MTNNGTQKTASAKILDTLRGIGARVESLAYDLTIGVLITSALTVVPAWSVALVASMGQSNDVRVQTQIALVRHNLSALNRGLK